MKLVINEVLIDKLNRIDSPIAKALVELNEQEIEGLNINYIGISRDNPSYISYLDIPRIERIKNEERKIYKLNQFTCNVNPEGFVMFRGDDSDWPNEVENDNTTAEVFLNHGYENTNANTITVYQNFMYFKESEISNIELIESRIRDFVEAIYPIVEASGARHNLIARAVGYGRPNAYIGSRLFARYMLQGSVRGATFEKIGVNLEEDFWNPNKRYHSSIGKIIRRIITDFESRFTFKDLESFVSLYKLESFKECGELGDLIFEEVSGEKIRWAYREDNYYQGTGELGSSCMRYSYCQTYLNIYVANPDKISLAILLKKDKVAARCLIWNISESERWHDRIYAIDENTKIAMKSRLEAYYDCYHGSKSVFIPLKYTDFDTYPYMDTFKYLDTGKGLSNDCNSSYDKELTDAEGNTDGSNECSYCGAHEDSDSLYEITMGRYRGDFMCSNCCTHTNDDECIISDSAIWCEYVQGYYHVDDVTELHNGDYAHNDDVIETYEGNYYLDEDISEYAVEHKGQWYEFTGDYAVEVNGEWYHVDSEDIEYIEGEYVEAESERYYELLEQVKLKENEQKTKEESKIQENQANQPINESSTTNESYTVESIQPINNNEFIL